MKTRLQCILVLFLLSGSTYAADLAAGKEKAVLCQACHGKNFNTSVGNWPKLAGQHAEYTRKQLQDFAKGAEGCRDNATMYGIAKSLSAEDMNNISAYFASLKGESGTAKTEQLARGAQLYRAGDRDKHITACMACHGPAGEGVASARFPRLAGQNSAYVTIQLKAFRGGSRCNDSHRMMHDIAYRMSDDDIKAVSNYIQGLYNRDKIDTSEETPS